MNETRARDLFFESQRRPLTIGESETLENFLQGRPELRREFEQTAATLHQLDAMPAPRPSPRLRQGVLVAIENEKRAVRSAPPTPTPRPAPPARPRWWALAQFAGAVGFLFVGYVLGHREGALREGDTNAALAGKVASLEKQMNSMGTLVGYSLLQQQQRPTNDRLSTVLASANLSNPDARVINDLIGSLALDPSTIVRLNALEALYPHAQQDVVRAGVLASLPREQSPIVQVAMIDFLVAARDRDATPALEKISTSDAANEGVRDAAKRALTQL